MGKHLVTTALLWAALTAVGELLVFSPLFPTVGSESAEESDHIFRVLSWMGVPVLTMVIAVLFYAFTSFRGSGRTGDEGATFFGTGMVPRAWLAVTGGLAVRVMIYPGLTGLSTLQKSQSGSGWGATEAELTIEVTAFRYGWFYAFPAEGVQIQQLGVELLLPVDTEIRFEVQAEDVIHSFWIPAFRMKIDAIPGRTTYMTVRTTAVGSYVADDAFRVQCAELCGLDHTRMQTPIRVVPRAEFDAWLASLRGNGN